MNKSFDATESSLIITYKADEDQSFYTMVIDSFDDLDSELEVYEFYTVDGKGDVSDKSHHRTRYLIPARNLEIVNRKIVGTCEDD